MSEKRFLVVSYDVLGEIQAGPALRTLALASELSKIGHVEVVYPGQVPAQAPSGVDFTSLDDFDRSPGSFSKYTASLAPPLVAFVLPELLESDIPICIDLFDPVILENLDLYSSKPLTEQEFQHERHLAALISGLLRGDYFLVAGNRQQDLFLGTLMALNRVNPSTFKPGSSIKDFIGYVPFGLSGSEAPVTDPELLPDEFRVDGPMIVWGGGLWDWLDPEIVVKAMPKVLESFKDARLVFPGTCHPNPHVPEPKSLEVIKSTAKNLKIEDTIIYGSWLPRDQYLALLSVAACGVSAHREGLESRYAVRTRFLDAFSAGLPMVVSGGDEYSPIITENRLGIVVGKHNVAEFTSSIVKVLDNGRDSYKQNFNAVRKNLTWEKTSTPLIEWMKSPLVTHGAGASFFQEALGETNPRNRPNDLGSLMGRVMNKLKKM